MKGILIIVVWVVVVLTAIAGYLVWEKTRTMVIKNKTNENNKDVVNRYGYLRVITIFILIGLFVISVISLLEATDSTNYFKF